VAVTSAGEGETMKDAELMKAFEDCTIDKRSWNHEAHVRVAWLHLGRDPFAAALEKLGAGIRRLNAAHGVRDGLETGYHETLTCAFLCAIWATTQSAPPSASSREFWNANPHLWARTLPRLYYTRGRIMTREAKAQFVPPDIAPLPSPPGWRPAPGAPPPRHSEGTW
jgi:hypothetical protein